MANLLAACPRRDRLRHVRRLPARPAQAAAWPDWVEPDVRHAWQDRGIETLWSHQRAAADLAAAGTHVVLATGTASGKSLGYLLPVLSSVVAGARQPTARGATALYLAPTKALGADQLASVQALALDGVRAAAYDGDTPADQRRWIREHAQLVLTNPDLLHHTMLPRHEQWSAFLRALRYVVVDECHVYRGVFGAHVAAVLRRLRRVAARYRSFPTFVLASATTSEPAAHAAALVGMPVVPVVNDGSPRGELTFALWEPGFLPATHELPARRRGAVAETADLLAELVEQGVQTLAFARSRSGVETLAAAARRRLADRDPGLAAAVASYRGGYLPEERRALEASLRSGSVRGLAATNALELGIDISGLDAVLLAGWPGTRASLWQQAGRAGRRRAAALAVFVADDDPLDTFLVRSPEALLDQPLEATVLDPGNVYVLAPHLVRAAAEVPLRPDDAQLFGEGFGALVAELTRDGVLRRRPQGWFWPHPEPPEARLSLRGAGRVVRIVERGSGRVLGTVDEVRAHSSVHTGAVYVHQGQAYVVVDLDLADDLALVVAGNPGWSTVARSVSTVAIRRATHRVPWGQTLLCFGLVDVDTQVVSFLRRLPTGEVLGEHALDLPVRRLSTQAVWWTMPEDLLTTAGIDVADIPGAAHAAEHAAIGMLPLVATSDRWDVGGVSTALHADTGQPTIVVYDGYPGGAGFARRGFDEARQWLSATCAAVQACACADGCPACVHSPKCGSGNKPLDKAAAVLLLQSVLRHAPESR